MAQMHPLLARQPIFDRNMGVVAYELLYRASLDNHAAVTDGNTASTQVLLNAFTELSVEKVVGQHRAFINFTGDLMDARLPFDTSQLVVEVLESEAIDSNLLHRLKTLRENGFAIALDDFEITEESEPLLAYADIVKLDVLALSEQQLVTHIQQLKNLGIQVLAEKIETFEMLEQCKAMGCDMFQGYFLERPAIIEGHRLNESKQAVLQLLAKLNEANVAFTDVEEIISRDPVLSFKLLRLVNSAAFGLPRTIESLRQALTLLGLKIIKNWIGLLAMAKLGDKPAELSAQALTRAKLCELMAAQTRPESQCDTFFTAGLLSMLDAFMDSPLESVLAEIQLSEELKAALLDYSGEEGNFLRTVIHYEHGEWNAIDWDYLKTKDLDPGSLSTLYLQTLCWVDETQRAIQAEVQTLPIKP
ncbi:HDOD domain-containing protein [Gilvimarinus sp. SDUM040013]|uniref:HDOD domain-containing protein n=1 Tax=Gilvimarinus gilvus TaxID=3058038 RepID=A0ABU4S1G6_9GAMM|nr:HDOD domain-containing protein [Gilvimarinus sp. SDUM040013]MDO3386402.1 HDOD domain-containing protein [Gilvimarinus sp. SDUM040013]MDX6849668.1 HDOD domain-containing protein [Gilvimarinus sp. SDUM040013]